MTTAMANDARMGPKKIPRRRARLQRRPSLPTVLGFGANWVLASSQLHPRAPSTSLRTDYDIGVISLAVAFSRSFAQPVTIVCRTLGGHKYAQPIAGSIPVLDLN